MHARVECQYGKFISSTIESEDFEDKAGCNGYMQYYHCFIEL